MIRRRIDSKIEIWDASYINNQFARSTEDKGLEIEQIEPCGNMFIVEVFEKDWGNIYHVPAERSEE